LAAARLAGKRYNQRMESADANRQIVRKSTLAEQGNEDDLRDLSIEDRWNMMWQLTVEAWAKKGIDVSNQPMRRDIVRVTRNGPNHE
jgi:hypothetical protein